MSDPSMVKNTDFPTFDVAAIRQEFPILAQEIHGKPLVYLDNGASSQKPVCVLDAMDRYYREMHSNVHRGAHTLGDRATAAFEGAREIVRQFLNARNTR
ncbi:MAG: aminotransferase class V-fold PLP-dependent enzyme, partial [Marinobacter sp.]|nr:aminotransferase class V-fold PLP-dependent enzyme [Marinobacter sp.]